jgi:hypothetical protein
VRCGLVIVAAALRRRTSVVAGGDCVTWGGAAAPVIGCKKSCEWPHASGSLPVGQPDAVSPMGSEMQKEAKKGLAGQIRTRDLEPSSWGTSGEVAGVQGWTRLDTAGRVVESPGPSSLKGRASLIVVQRSQCPVSGLPPSRLTSPEACRTRISASRTCIEALHHHHTPATICTTTTVL